MLKNGDVHLDLVKLACETSLLCGCISHAGVPGAEVLVLSIVSGKASEQVVRLVLKVM